ncbi:nuclear transport factor 2 family protein [Cellulomonas fimi]|uniref:nuclear transport factor 2 family protein n=1 Tax=Cellulomonas fimi TaxID=1708 RepID=UPI00234DE2FE|nr:nuclear transport factor 2 family protein [Cellulomonas fimi]MDC7123309.1 nuclear transport factor 2 family protein [Cellulomonas fimi]
MTTGRALQTALDYHRAWSSHDVDAAMALVADDVVCDSPGGPVTGIDAFRAFMGPFATSTTRTEILGAFGDDVTAVVLYDTDSTLVRHAPGAEWVRVTDGRITHMTIVFDRLPFAQARAAAG